MSQTFFNVFSLVDENHAAQKFYFKDTIPTVNLGSNLLTSYTELFAQFAAVVDALSVPHRFML